MSSVTKITLLGTTYSSFTIVIRLALDYYKIPYDMIPILPQSKKAKQYSAIGKIPILLVPERSEPLIESQVIAKYLDYLHDTTKTNDNQMASLTPKDIESQLDMTLWISLVNDVLVNSMKVIFLPILMMRFNKKATEEEIQTILSTKFASQVKTVRQLLQSLNQTLFKQQQKRQTSVVTPYLLGHSHPTWADFYLHAVFHGIVGLNHGLENECPLIYDWYQRFDQLDLVRHVRRPANPPSSSNL